ncbi:MAG: fumarylacetoacetate hydrolase family protein [Verrucomicrobiota bacterium]
MSLPTVTVYRIGSGLVAQRGDTFFQLAGASLDTLFTQENPAQWLAEQLTHAEEITQPNTWLSPIENQEVWASGVTYLRSRDARIEESKDAGGGTFYDRVYAADRPELFFKATAHRVVAPGGSMRLRSDSKWNVPEPELALAINSHGTVFGYTVANDLSSRDIEGENPLYLPQAKVWSQCCALGPGIVVGPAPAPTTTIQLTIFRNGTQAFSGATSLDQMKRTLPELASWLWRDNAFPTGTFLLTGTGLVPGDEFTLLSGDEIRITIAGIGTLTNTIA